MQPIQKSLKGKLIYLLVAGCLNFILTITLIIAMSIQGYTGFGYSTPVSITINKCTQNYYLTKYDNVQTILLAVLVSAILSLIIELILIIVILQIILAQATPT